MFRDLITAGEARKTVKAFRCKMFLAKTLVRYLALRYAFRNGNRQPNAERAYAGDLSICAPDTDHGMADEKLALDKEGFRVPAGEQFHECLLFERL